MVIKTLDPDSEPDPYPDSEPDPHPDSQEMPDPFPEPVSMYPDPQHCVKVPLTCFVGFQSWLSFRSKSATKLPLQKREDRVTVGIFLQTEECSMNALRKKLTLNFTDKTEFCKINRSI